MKKLLRFIWFRILVDFKQMLTDYKVWQVIRLIRKSLKHAYKMHMLTNKKYYVIRMSKTKAENFTWNSGVFVVNNNSCVIINTAQSKYYVAKKILKRNFWKKRNELDDVFPVDGHFNLRSCIDFTNELNRKNRGFL